MKDEEQLSWLEGMEVPKIGEEGPSKNTKKRKLLLKDSPITIVSEDGKLGEYMSLEMCKYWLEELVPQLDTTLVSQNPLGNGPNGLGELDVVGLKFEDDVDLNCSKVLGIMFDREKPYIALQKPITDRSPQFPQNSQYEILQSEDEERLFSSFIDENCPEEEMEKGPSLSEAVEYLILVEETGVKTPISETVEGGKHPEEYIQKINEKKDQLKRNVEILQNYAEVYPSVFLTEQKNLYEVLPMKPFNVEEDPSSKEILKKTLKFYGGRDGNLQKDYSFLDLYQL